VTATVQDGRIDERGLEHLRAQVGVRRQFRPWNSTATADAIWHFVLGVGDDNPLWQDRDYATSTAWGGLIAPPTFLSTCSTGGAPPGVTTSGEVDDLLPGVLGLWAGDRWKNHAPAREGMSLSATQELLSADLLPDTGRGVRVLQVERQSFYGDGRLLSECDKSIIRFERSDSTRHGRSAAYVRPRYTAEERAAIHAHYEAEYQQRRGARPLTASDVSVGDPIPRLVKGPLTIGGMVGWLLGWGSYMCQTNRLQHTYLKNHAGALLFDDAYGIDDTIEAPHFNADLARKSGLPNSYDFGGQRTAWLAHMLTDWCGDDGFVTDIDTRLRLPNYVGDTLWLDGAVTSKRHADVGEVIDCSIRAVNQRGEVVSDGTASVLLEAPRSLQ
jgi:acyl dehydratase